MQSRRITLPALGGGQAHIVVTQICAVVSLSNSTSRVFLAHGAIDVDAAVDIVLAQIDQVAAPPAN